MFPCRKGEAVPEEAACQASPLCSHSYSAVNTYRLRKRHCQEGRRAQSLNAEDRYLGIIFAAVAFPKGVQNFVLHASLAKLR